MFETTIRDDVEQAGRRGGAFWLVLALVAGLTVGTTPAVTLADAEDEEEGEVVEYDEKATDMQTSRRFPSECEDNEAVEEICGPDVAMIRIIKHGEEESEDRIDHFVAHGQVVSEIDRAGRRIIYEDESDDRYVKVTITVSKELLRQLHQSDDIHIDGVSVFGRIGDATCYWDCRYVNGKKECTCIKY